ncbi:MAG: VanW family protein [Clostridiales bacterium]|nr:VanW family protein [Candidatus Apopatousia equi]
MKRLSKNASKNNDLEMKNKKSKNRKLLWGSAFLGLALIITLFGQIQGTNGVPDAFNQGTYINGERVGGYSVEQASKFVSQRMSDKIDGISIDLIYKDNVWNLNQDDFEINEPIRQVVQRAYEVKNASTNSEEKTNSKILNSVYKNNNDKNFKVSIDKLIKNYDQKIDEIAKKIETEPKNAYVEFKPNESEMFEVKEGVCGVKVDREKLKNDLENQFLKTKEIKVYITTISCEPEISSDFYNNKLNLMSKFETDLTNSQEGRRFNVAHALSKFNGKVVKAGEKVSFNETTGPQTKEGGYKPAIVILNNKFTTGIGGGICQASTTLYNACVLANLEINEVHKHSLPVGYVELSLDAMVSEGYSDFVFTNNSNDDLYFKCYLNGDKATVEIYGNSIEEGMTIKRVAEFIGNVPHNGDKIIVDTNGEYTDKVLYKGEYYRLSYPREGYEAKAYKEIYKDGKLVDRQEIRHEVYQPLDGKIIEGAKEPPEDYVIPESDVEFIKPQKNTTTSVETMVQEVKKNNPTAFNL